MRSLVETSQIAYLGALEMAIPSFTGEEQICSQLEGVVGGDESWGIDSLPDSRWDVLELSGCRDGVEMRAAVDGIQEQYRLNSMFLSREMEGVLSEGILALGEGNYRSKVVEQMDQTRHLLLTKALELHPNQEARPAWSWTSVRRSTWPASLTVRLGSLLLSLRRLLRLTCACLVQPAHLDWVRW